MEYFSEEEKVSHPLLIFARNFVFTGSYIHFWYLPSLIVAVALVSFLLYKGVRPRTIVLIAGGFYFVGLFAQSWFGFIRPLESRLPVLWSALKTVQTVIVTTKDGLFDGFLFVAIGMWFSCHPIRFSVYCRKRWKSTGYYLGNVIK